jgi:hypothetical protein
MATLCDEPVYPGDSVYDLCYGPGTVTAVEKCEFYVSFGCGRPRRYNEQGMTGRKSFGKTLYWHKPIITELPKNECDAGKIRAAFADFLQIAQNLTRVKSCEVEDPCNPCDYDRYPDKNW